MLCAVQVIHEESIVHSDLKPANFVVVKGRVKLIDFGISKAIAADTTNIGRDQQIGTANYMPPEALLDTGLGDDGKRLMKVSSLTTPLFDPSLIDRIFPRIARSTCRCLGTRLYLVSTRLWSTTLRSHPRPLVQNPHDPKPSPPDQLSSLLSSERTQRRRIDGFENQSRTRLATNYAKLFEVQSETTSDDPRAATTTFLEEIGGRRTRSVPVFFSS